MGSRIMGQFGTILKEAWSKTLPVAKFLCFLHVTGTYGCQVSHSYGPSMLPTLGSTNYLIYETISTRCDNIRPGDIVIVRSVENPRKYTTKRLIGMEGDTVTYLVDPKESDKCETVVIPKGHIWVQGDNIYDSNDSRKFGPVPYGLLIGKAFWKIWPPEGFGSLGKN
ncbi:hypothetical protein L6164_031821 [Bauhinia variegata]|uniref:Uncharacterized protein n=1 Tax=Bauhinia variegata TaxID=167791 RepID=A0ACB9KLR6_BAUVA|nr:hypothetical protein L6164_031821 [Bauhinia variegata]